MSIDRRVALIVGMIFAASASAGPGAVVGGPRPNFALPPPNASTTLSPGVVIGGPRPSVRAPSVTLGAGGLAGGPRR